MNKRPDPYSEEGDIFFATHCADCLKPNEQCTCLEESDYRSGSLRERRVRQGEHAMRVTHIGELPEVRRYHDDGKHNFMLHGGFGIRYIRESVADAALAAAGREVERLRDILSLRDSDLAHFEAENEGLRTLRDGWVRVCKQHDQILGDSAIEWEDQAQRLLTRLSRECATCSQWNHGHRDDGDIVNYCRQLDHAIPRDFGCNRWAGRMTT